MSDLPAFLAPVLEDLASLRSSTARRLRALRAVDGLLATLFLPPADEEPQAKDERKRIAVRFVSLQEDVATSVVSRLTPLAARLLPVLHGQLLTHAPVDEVETTAAELSATFLVIQGLALVHPPTKALVGGTRSSMEMMLDLLLLTRHLPSSGTVAPPPLNAPVEGSDHSSKPKTTPSLAPPPLAAVLLDVLFAVLVDAPEGVRVFERAGGLEIVRKVLKSKSVVKEVRMKCLEFLLFYLLPEGSEGDPTAAASLAALLPSSAALSAVVAGGGRSHGGFVGASPGSADPVAGNPSPLLPSMPGDVSRSEEHGRRTPTSPRLPMLGAQASPTPPHRASAGPPSSTNVSVHSRAFHRRAESAASGLSSALNCQARRDAAAADRLSAAPDRPSSAASFTAGGTDVGENRRPRSRGTTAPDHLSTAVAATELPRDRPRARKAAEDAELVALISRARATPSRSVSTVAPHPAHRPSTRPPLGPAGQSSSRARSTASIPTVSSPSTAPLDRRALAAPTPEPPRTPTTGSRYRSSASSRADLPPRSPSSSSAASAAGASGTKLEASGRARERQALLEAFLQTPQKATTHAHGQVAGEQARTPSRYRLDDDSLVEQQLSSSAASSAARAGLPPPTPRHAFRPTTLVPGSGKAAKASVIEPRTNGPMLPPAYVPSQGRRASSAVPVSGSPGLRRSRMALETRPARSSTPAEVTLASRQGARARENHRPSFFDPLPLPKRGSGAAPSLPPRNPSATSSTAASATEHPSPLLPLLPPAPSPSLTASWGSPLSTPATSPDPSRPSASAPPTPSSSSCRPVASASGLTPYRLRPGPAVLSDVQAFVLSPSTVKAERARGRPELGKENLAGLLEGRTSVVGRAGGVGLGFDL